MTDTEVNSNLLSVCSRRTSENQESEAVAQAGLEEKGQRIEEHPASKKIYSADLKRIV